MTGAPADRFRKFFQLLKLLLRQNPKTLYFNFRYFPFRQAIQIPVKVSRRVRLMRMDGKIIIEDKIQPEMIRIGYGNVTIFDEKVSRTIWNLAGTIIFKGYAFIGHGSKITAWGTLVFGRGFAISAECAIVASNRIEFGENCLISWDTLIMDTDFHQIKDKSKKVINPSEPVLVGKNVWIGCRCIILKGAVIPDNSVIGAGSLVGNRLEKEGAVYAGQPAKLIKEDISWSS